MCKKARRTKAFTSEKRREGKDWRNDWSRTNEWLFHSDLLSVYTPKQEGLNISGKLEGGRILKYDLHSDDRTYITRISIDCDYRKAAKETADVLNAGFEDEADQYKAFTIGKYSGYKKTTVYDSSDKTYSKMLIDYPVGEDNVVLQIYVEQEGVNDLDEVTRAILDNIVVEICMEE